MYHGINSCRFLTNLNAKDILCRYEQSSLIKNELLFDSNTHLYCLNHISALDWKIFIIPILFLLVYSAPLNVTGGEFQQIAYRYWLLNVTYEFFTLFIVNIFV
jgi:hypothetical protein